MTDPSQLTVLEAFLVGGLITLIGWEAVRAWSSRQWVSVFRPTLIVAVILMYYCLLGPLWMLQQGSWSDRGVGLRDAMVWSWGGAFVYYLCVLIGFRELPAPAFRNRLIATVDPERLFRVGTLICWVGLGMFTIVSGLRVLALLNPLADSRLLEGGLEEGGVDVGALANYFALAVNFLIPGTAMIWTSWLLRRRHTSTLVLWTLAAVAIYTSLGFRYRLVLIAAPFLLLWYLVRQCRPRLLTVTLGIVALFFVSGVIGLTREYGRGLDLSALQGANAQKILESGFHESSIFLTTGGVMQITPSSYPHVGAEPLISTILYPVPRAIFPEKRSEAYLQNALAALYGSRARATGAAILNFGEYFLIAGWPSLILLSLLMGWLMRCLWNWFLVRHQEPFAQVLYVLTVSYLYVVVSRGYLPQVVLLFAFSVAPMFWLYGLFARRVLLSSGTVPCPPPRVATPTPAPDPPGPSF